MPLCPLVRATLGVPGKSAPGHIVPWHCPHFSRDPGGAGLLVESKAAARSTIPKAWTVGGSGLRPEPWKKPTMARVASGHLCPRMHWEDDGHEQAWEAAPGRPALLARNSERRGQPTVPAASSPAD